MKYLIIGYGITGKAVESFLKKRDYKYEIFDENEDKTTVRINDILNKMIQFDLGIKSPGFKTNSIEYQIINRSCKQIISELDFAYSFLPKTTLIGITGSNGKTSFGRFLTMFLSAKYRAFFTGNCGFPLISFIDEIKEDDYVVIEVSNYMLNDLKNMKFDYFFITNITPNHLDAYKYKEEYYLDKMRAFFFSQEVYFIYSWNTFKELIINDEDNVEKIISNQLNGYFNIKYALNAYYFCKKQGIDTQKLKLIIPKLKNEKYRLEKIYEKDGIIFINDSKSTTSNSSLGCYRTFSDKKRILILGGIHKSSSFDMIKIKNDDMVYIYGRDKEIIASQINGYLFNSIKEIIIHIKENIKSDCYILFSPGCSSFDQFQNFVERGEIFNSLVNEYFYHN